MGVKPAYYLNFNSYDHGSLAESEKISDFNPKKQEIPMVTQAN